MAAPTLTKVWLLAALLARGWAGDAARRAADPLGSTHSFSTGKARFRGHGAGRPAAAGDSWFVKRKARAAARRASSRSKPKSARRRLPSVAEVAASAQRKRARRAAVAAPPRKLAEISQVDIEDQCNEWNWYMCQPDDWCLGEDGEGDGCLDRVARDGDGRQADVQGRARAGPWHLRPGLGALPAPPQPPSSIAVSRPELAI